LEGKSYDKKHEPRQSPSEGDDCLVPFFVGEVETGKLDAEPVVDSVSSQFPEAEEGIACQEETSQEGEGLRKDANGGVMLVDPMHAGIVQERIVRDWMAMDLEREWAGVHR
jgi:hypothetical protein